MTGIRGSPLLKAAASPNTKTSSWGLQYIPHRSVRPIPDEILSEVLIYAWNHCQLNYQQFCFPHEMMLVCKHWKVVTLSTAALWSYIQLTGIPNINLAKVVTRLARTKGCPIDLYLSGGGRGTQEINDEAILEALWRLLLPFVSHKSRLWRVDLRGRVDLFPTISNLLLGRHESCTPQYSTLPSTSQPDSPFNATNLSSVRILSLWIEYGPKVCPPLPTIYLPSLRTLTCRAPPLDIIFKSPTLQSGIYGRLVKLRMCSSIWNAGSLWRFHSTLEQNPGLETLSFEDVFLMVGEPLRGRPASLPHLTFLLFRDINGLGAQPSQTLLATFTAPRLRDLVLEGMRDQRVPILYDTVKRISLSGRIADVLPMCPHSITHLFVTRPIEGVDSLVEFIGSGTTTPRLPRLHTLIIERVDLPLVMKVLKAQPSTIKTVQINSGDLCWVEEERPQSESSNRKEQYSFEQHQENTRWLKQNFCVEIWGRPFEEAYSKLPDSIAEKTVWEASVTLLCEGLSWIENKNVWTGEIPLGPYE